jgi:Holliday junction resolvase RusA-like endonuclease
VKAYRGSSRWEIFLPLTPVPASRPRFTRTGRVYFGKRYTAFRKDAALLFENAKLPRSFPLEGSLAVSAVFHVVKPRTSKRQTPIGDVDNYFKTLDVLNGVVWDDDDQLVWASMCKRFSDTPGISLEVMRVERVPEARTLPALWVKG